MTIRWLRHKTDGTIYEWDPILDKNPKVEEVTEEEAFPERFMPTHVVERAKKKGGRPRKSVDVGLDDIPEEPVYTNQELGREAAKGWPK